MAQESLTFNLMVLKSKNLIYSGKMLIKEWIHSIIDYKSWIFLSFITPKLHWNKRLPFNNNNNNYNINNNNNDKYIYYNNSIYRPVVQESRSVGYSFMTR